MKLNKQLRVNFDSAIKSVTKDEESEDLIISGYANTVAKDRAGDVILKEAWEKPEALKNYEKNPIILAYHNHSMPIGKMIDFNITDLGLEIKAKISKGAGPVYDLIKDGVLSTFSVGFGIKDAKYEPKEDTYYIKDLELFEVSVVSIPCNQDSTFSISKSMEQTDFELLKTQLTPVSGDDNEGKKEMPDFNIEDFKKEMAQIAGQSAATAIADAEKAKADREAAEKAAAEKAAAEKAAAKEMATEAAKSLVEGLESKMSEGQSAFAETVKAQQEEIIALKDEIAQVIASRDKAFTMNPVAAGMAGQGDREKEKAIEEVVLLGMVTKTPMFETEHGKLHVKAVNASSSAQVSSEAYETVFSTNLQRDILAKLVVAPLFREINMTAANLTLPIQPGRQNANWVSAANMADGSSKARTGDELSFALTEINLKTFKLAAKSYITEETTEDAIMPLLPLIRQNLVDAHANEIDRAFLLGAGTTEPSGLVTRAVAAEAGAADSAGNHITTATADGVTPVTAKMILQARKKLKLYGLDVKDVTLVVSTEAYFSLLEDEAWADVNVVGASNAVKLSGQVGSIYGMPVIVSDQFEAPGLSKAYAVMVNTMNYVVPRQRGVTVKTDFDVELDRRVIVATQRLNLESIIRASDGTDKGVVAISYAAA